jgi:hypothetical protein
MNLLQMPGRNEFIVIPSPDHPKLMSFPQGSAAPKLIFDTFVC